MNLESQVVSLPLAKRLKELGVKQDAYFTWGRPNNNTPHVVMSPEVASVPTIRGVTVQDVSAFTVGELGEMLPGSAWSDNMEAIGTLEIMRGDNDDAASHWVVTYASGQGFFDGPKLADELAKMLIYLIEKGVVKP